MRIGILIGTNNLGMKDLYIDDNAKPYIVQTINGMCGRESYRVYIDIVDDRTQVGEYTYRVKKYSLMDKYTSALRVFKPHDCL